MRAFELADELVIEVYAATRSFPNEERYGLVSQMRRSAVSVPTNIVEGCARQTEKDYLHFLNIAFSSLRELGYYIDLSRRLEFIKPDLAKSLDEHQSETARVMAALIRALKNQT